ncbi:MAG: STN domain-containing protein [Planctomycetes bacterium]|nr:STN domain-containing protein [Planctomycetota bacterium]
MVTIIGLILAVCHAGQIPLAEAGERPAVEYLTGPKFRVELDQATSGTWANVELRELLYTLASQRRVAILLDRRIDPTIRMPLEIVNRSLQDGLQEIAEKVAAQVSIPENVVYVGPAGAVRPLRTLIELRTAELQSKSQPVTERRRAELTKRQTVTWKDLNTPSEILQQIADQNRLEIRHAERVPHDLWAGNTLPGVTAAEALSLVLIQWNLTFAWLDGGQGIELVPIPDTVVVERRPRIKGRTAADMQKLVSEQLPDLDARLDGGEFVVRGTVEEQEEVVQLLNPTTRKPATPVVAPLRQRKYTLNFKRAPVRGVMRELERSKVVFVYDAAALKSAGIDLDQTVDLTLEGASADEFFQKLFTPLNLSFEIDNVTVKLTPKK